MCIVVMQSERAMRLTGAMADVYHSLWCELSRQEARSVGRKKAANVLYGLNTDQCNGRTFQLTEQEIVSRQSSQSES